MPSSDLTLRVEITSEKGWCSKVSCPNKGLIKVRARNRGIIKANLKTLLLCKGPVIHIRFFLVHDSIRDLELDFSLLNRERNCVLTRNLTEFGQYR